MKKEMIKIIKKDVVHWSNMLKWAKKQDPEKQIDWSEMLNTLKEAWGSAYCNLCKENRTKGTYCTTCLLAKHYGTCTGEDNENAWLEITEAKTWKNWIIAATKMRKQIKSLLPKNKGE